MRVTAAVVAFLAALAGVTPAAVAHDATRAQDSAEVEVAQADARFDQLAEQLTSDPVHVDRTMGNGDVSAVRDLLRSDVADAPFPAYVVLINRVPGDNLPDQPDELAALLHDRIGEDGLYVVGIGNWVEAIAPGLTDVDPLTLTNAAFYATENLDATPAAQARAFVGLAPVVGTDRRTPEAEATTAELTEQLAADPLMTRTKVDYSEISTRRELTSLGSAWDANSNAPLGFGFFVGIVTAVVAAVVLAWRATRGDAVGQATDVSAARQRLRAALAVIDAARSGDALSPGTGNAGTGDAGTGHVDTGHVDTGHVDTERHVWFQKAADAANLLRDSRDPVDVVGATVLAEAAVAALGKNRPFEPPRPCYLNPLHGQHSTTSALPGDKSGLRVPVCASCANDIQTDRRPDILRIKQGLRVVPYYRRPDVWSVSGFGALRDDVADLVLAGARAGTALPGRLAHETG